MQILIVSIWVSQGILMLFDEFKFHHERGLKKWERIGHPVDSLFFLAPFLYTLKFTNIYVFIGLCVISSLIVTKDEFVHTKECEASEQWLHSLLFLIHPVAFLGLWVAWQNNFSLIIQAQSAIIFLFMLYQIIYWNLMVGAKNEAKSK